MFNRILAAAFMVIVGLLLLGLIFALGRIWVNAQQPQNCYSVSLGFTVTDAAQAIIDSEGLSLPEMQTDMVNSLNRYQQMTGQCFTGELGMIFGTLPNRVFAVFASSNPDYGLTRVMTEDEYYPEPFSPNTVGWQRSTNVLP